MRVLAALSALVAIPVFAQPAQVDVRAERLGNKTVRVSTRWEADGNGSARLQVGNRATLLHEGGGVAATLAVGHDRVLVAYEVDAERHPFRVRVVNRQGEVGEEIQLPRPDNRHDLPFAVVATPTPRGFTVFFQEVQENDPSAAHTYMALLNADGQTEGDPREVRVPWALADALWNGSGYHLALIYPGNGQGMRLSMVSTSPEGVPQQHPDWASAAGMVMDVHLAQVGERILAFYADGGAILESDVTQIRGWGSEPPQARRRGRLHGDQVIVLARNGSNVRPTTTRAR